MSQDDELIVFKDEEEKPQTSGESDLAERWHILVVDDEPEVHTVTRLALKGFSFAGKELYIQSAESASEAKSILEGPNKFSIILLDVVMESEHAGLDLARWIREDLRDQHVRLVLRTGQPGQAPEREVISTYDINDYKEKTELTANKLYTLVYSCLRAYRDIVALYENKIGLETIINSTNKIFGHQSLTEFTQGALHQLCALLHIDTGAIYSEIDGLAATHGETRNKILAATGRFTEFLNGRVEDAFNGVHNENLDRLLEESGQEFGENYFIGVYHSHLKRKNLLFLEGLQEITELDKQLVQIFGNNIGVAFDNQSMFEEIETTQREMVYRLSEAVESRSKETSNHVKRMALTCRFLAEELDLDPHDVETLYKAAPLHDIGKIAIPDRILNKPGKLDSDEWTQMQSHAQIGFELLANSELEVLRAGAVVAGEHHECWDGTGYPKGKCREDIHVFGRIASVADVFDALVNKRCYKPAWNVEETLEYFKDKSGKQFEPRLVDLMVKNIDKMMEIQREYAD